MKFCDKHWSALRAAIDARGLSHLVARSGDEAAEAIAAELRGEERQFVDPLMSAHNMIMCRAIEEAGLAILAGDLCPVCEAMKGYARAQGHPEADTELAWIEGPADAALKQSRELGLIPTPGVPPESDR